MLVDFVGPLSVSKEIMYFNQVLKVVSQGIICGLIKDPKLSLTKSYKLIGDPEKIKLPESRINTIIENGGMCDVVIDGSEIKFNEV